MRRIFIVGVARSGTTLLQSMLGSHPHILTFPESHFFSKTIDKRKLLRVFHTVNDSKQKYVSHFLDKINHSNLYKPYQKNSRNLTAWVNYLVSTLDEIAMKENYETWLEKTPMHLYYAELIEQQYPDAYFIHSIRKPLANIASLWYMSKKHPDSFAQNTLDKAISRYKREIKLSEKMLPKPNHFHQIHEALVEKPEEELKKLCQFLNIDYTQEMLLDFQFTAKRIRNEKEEWKKENSELLLSHDKTKDRLSEEELNYVVKKMNGFESELLT